MVTPEPVRRRWISFKTPFPKDLEASQIRLRGFRAFGCIETMDPGGLFLL
jgi:hypothetical protein